MGQDQCGNCCGDSNDPSSFNFTTNHNNKNRGKGKNP